MSQFVPVVANGDFLALIWGISAMKPVALQSAATGLLGHCDDQILLLGPVEF
jgi:hypothetical protein